MHQNNGMPWYYKALEQSACVCDTEGRHTTDEGFRKTNSRTCGTPDRGCVILLRGNYNHDKILQSSRTTATQLVSASSE